MRWASPGEATPTVNGAPRKDSSNLSVHTPAFGNGTSIVSAEPLKFRITMAYSSGPAGPPGPWRGKGVHLLPPHPRRLFENDPPARTARRARPQLPRGRETR